MVFVILTLGCLYCGRRVGWGLSKHFLYSVSEITAVIACIIWGGLVAILVHGLIVWLHPQWILKWIFGFALGGYVSIPNYGLFAESTIPDHEMLKHNLIFTVPFAAFVIFSVVFAYLI